MTILVDHEIELKVSSGLLIIEPFDRARLQPNSYDVLLGDSFAHYEKPYGKSDIIDPLISSSIHQGLSYFQQESILIEPGEFLLGCTVEKFSLPADIVGQLTGKSSIARLGIAIHITAGFIDAGFSSPPASITLEIYNHNCRAVRLHAGMPIGQMVFTQTAHCRQSYAHKPSAKYNGQVGATESRYFFDRKNQ